MRTITTFAEADEALLPYVPLVAQLTGKDTTLDRIRPLMELLGNPQNSTRVVHIAGTSGKTSTCYYIAALLRASGKKVGLTVSPHVDSVAERLQINGEPISESMFCGLLGEFLEIVDTAPQPPSYFELLYAFAFWVFRREAVDYAVVETGLGGLYDATNVVDRSDKLCVLTDIGYDHMHVLGDTLEAIALQKAGIMHAGNTALAYHQSEVVDNTFEAYARKVGAQLRFVDQAGEARKLAGALPQAMPDYQKRNWLLAHCAYWYLAGRDSLPKLSGEALAATWSVQVPGRMDARTIGTKTLVMDGAHNGQKMAAFVDSFRAAYPGVRPALLISLKQGKELDDVVPVLAALVSRVIVTQFDTSQDLPAKAIEPEVLAAAFKAAAVPNVTVVADQKRALDALLSGGEMVCVAAGSFYLLSQLRKLLPE